MHNDINTVKHIIKTAAIDELLSRFSKVKKQLKTDGSIVTQSDLAMQKRISRELLAKFPLSIVLSEEMTREEQNSAIHSDMPIWCLDPLDGTSNYAAGIPYFAVSLSLIHQAKIIIGLVYDPIRDELFTATEQEPALLNNKPLQCSRNITALNQAIAIIDFKRLKNSLAVKLLQHQGFASQRNFGASALDWCWLAANRGHVYLHGKQHIWDYSAGHYIFQKAGGYACTLDEEPVFIPQLNSRSVMAAVNLPLYNKWKNWINGSNA
ncbi:Inositol-1-monophosphatase [hydrothermal vent metagenome]|uniref:Inositol-1-monophosphatase n=1 Tax=hydrothermal vent metagenome TaxID=652676 RepID=A0A3B1AGK0_9ZZZZ